MYKQLVSHFSANNIEKNGVGGHVARMGEKRGVYRVMVGKYGGKRGLGRPRLRWEDNINVNPKEVGCEDMDWIDVAQDRDRWRALVNAVMNFQALLNAGSFLASREIISFSSTPLHGVIQ
jgi:hypothetical protein